MEGFSNQKTSSRGIIVEPRSKKKNMAGDFPWYALNHVFFEGGEDPVRMADEIYRVVESNVESHVYNE